MIISDNPSSYLFFSPKLDGSRFSLWSLNNRAFKVFNKEAKQNRYTVKRLIEKAFPAVPCSENKFVNVKGEKSPYDGDISYWSELHSKLYDGETSKALKRQNHKCRECGLKMLGDEKVHLHHVDGNHNNSKTNNLLAVHESCHDYLHMSSHRKLRTSGAGCRETSTSGSNSEVRRIIPPIDSTRAKIRDYDITQARLHRQTLCYSKSREMLKNSLRLLIHYLKFWEVPVPYSGNHFNRVRARQME